MSKLCLEAFRKFPDMFAELGHVIHSCVCVCVYIVNITYIYI